MGPPFGRAGANLSILDINESILISLTPEDFVNGSTDKVCGLVDGKDFKTETMRTHVEQDTPTKLTVQL